ncbi:unnamed protein product [Caenorhabditis auriculariae]|uniref:Carbohydrate sulfotransferase n=1 Tax=Caenorhabditis auriculariae TaxID=2777116 RepID=A0A8S1H2T2_9PELO|nr:unnamed protein product [Caenorhabditis auriculariae]
MLIYTLIYGAKTIPLKGKNAYKIRLVGFSVAPKFKMAHCVVHKSMSTVMTSIMCYLYNRTKYSRATQVKKLNEWQKYNLCQSENTYNSVFSVAKAFKFSNWSVSMITRDPVERFVSGYVDRCIRAPKGKNPCNGCDKNLTCFITAEYRKFMAINRKKHVPEDSLSFIRDELTANRRTSHTTAESPARTFYENRLRSNPFLMEYVVKMFYHDFVHLRYPFPDGF